MDEVALGDAGAKRGAGGGDFSLDAVCECAGLRRIRLGAEELIGQLVDLF
jgi:hypothetical protein